MEKLLNKLIEKGWKPRWHELHWLQILTDDVVLYLSDRVSMYKKFRELVSKESGLWQYVCENGMVKEDILMKSHRRELHTLYETEWYKKYWRVKDYEYRLIESALKYESELEEFLLSNIVIKDEE